MKRNGCEPPFLAQPSILFQNVTLQYRPTCEHSMVNFTARIVLISLFIGLIMSAMFGVSALLAALMFGIITAFAIIMMTPSLPTKAPTIPAVPRVKQCKDSSDGYYELPYTVTVDPSGFEAPIKEHFVNGGSTKGSVQPVGEPIGMAEVDAAPYSGASLPEFTPPTSRNLHECLVG